MPKNITAERVAALFENRGQLRTNVGGKHRQYRPLIQIITTDPLTALALHEWGGGKVDSFNPASDPRVTVFAWKARGQACVRALKAVLPHLREGEKADRAAYILERDRTKSPSTNGNGNHD